MFLLETILIIEDDEAVHSLLEEVLEQRYKLLDAYSGTEGKLLLSTYPVDLILLDLMLPGLSGEALLAETDRHRMFRSSFFQQKRSKR